MMIRTALPKRFSTLLALTFFGFSSCSRTNLDLSTPSENLIGPKDKGAKSEGLLQKELSKNPQQKLTEDRPLLHQTQTAPTLSSPVSNFCKNLKTKFKFYGWGEDHCQNYPWIHVRNSVIGHPLIWTIFGNEEEHRKKHKDTTLVLCGVHGDEITPIKFCFDVLTYLQKNYQTLYSDKLIVVAPVVNPDSFLEAKTSRTNKNGVDINRNFPTLDWRQKALKLWKQRFKSDQRRFPGLQPSSEPEVVFQINLIKRYLPDKIISVHAPLTMLDYDGPLVHSKEPPQQSDPDPRKHKGFLANRLLIQMSEKASGYKIRNFPYFPGSLGNWAGNERNIPTYTLELPTSDPRKNKIYWEMFQEAIHQAFLHDLRDPEFANIKNN